MPKTEPLIVKVGDAAQMLGAPVKTVYYWLYIGKLSKVDGTNYIARAEIERFAGERNGPQRPEEKRRGRYNKR